jgi:hypothetical protein
VAAIEQAGQGLVQPVGIADRGIELSSQPGDLAVRHALELEAGRIGGSGRLAGGSLAGHVSVSWEAGGEC